MSEAPRLDEALRANNDLKLVAYIMAGHPTRKQSIEVGKRLANSGIAALEIGIPHSDPLADGPVIQRGRLELDPVKHEVTAEGRPVAFTVTEYRILELLMRRSPAVVDRKGIAEHAWADEPPKRCAAGLAYMQSNR